MNRTHGKKRMLLFRPGSILDGGLLQSAEWQSFQEALGRPVAVWGDRTCSSLAILQRAPFSGTYWYLPRGPLVAPGTETLPALQEALAQGQAGWARVEPQDEAALEALRRTFGAKLVKAPKDIQPRETLLVSLEHGEDSLMARMKPKTRYNIRLAEKHGVTVRRGTAGEFPLFEELLNATAERKGLRTHAASYYRKLLETLPEKACLFFAEYEGRVLAGNLVLFVGDTATYLHGGTRDEARDKMAPFLLQWEQIREAKKRGLERYDFGGVKVASRGTDASWDGITRFKQGFSAATEPVLFPGTYDIILDGARYRRYTFLRSLRNLFS